MAELIISDVRPRVQYTADGVQTSFPYPFPIIDQADLIVVFDDNEAPGANTVSGVGVSSGGDVVFDAPPPFGTRITIYRDMAFARETDFQEAGDFRAAVINEELDRMAMLLQQAEMLVGDSLHKPLYDVDAELVLPSAASRAGKVLTFDDAGLPVIGTPSEEAATLAATSAAAAAASAATAAADASFAINTAVPVQQFSGDGATTAFTLSRTVMDSTSISVTIDGIKQHTATYTAAGTALNFTAAPPTGTNNIEATFIGFTGLTADLTVIPDTFRNVIINGNFDIWQRGASFTASGYTADRWQCLKDAGDTVTWSRQTFTPGQTDVPGEPAYYLRIAKTVSANAAQVLRQLVEGVRTLAGQTVTISYYAKVDATLSGPVTLQARQHFSPGDDVDVDINPVFTTSWAKYTHTITLASISGKTIGAGESLQLIWTLPDETFTLDVAQVQVEAGAVATPFERRPIGQVLTQCQRFFALLGEGAAGQWNSDTVSASLGLTFPVRMRAAPTLSLKSGTFSIEETSITTRTAASPAIASSHADINGLLITINGFTGATFILGAVSRSSLINCDAEL